MKSLKFLKNKNELNNCTEAVYSCSNRKAKEIKVSNRENRREFENTIKRNNLMKRFIWEIEREEPLEFDTMQTMLVYQPVTTKL